MASGERLELATPAGALRAGSAELSVRCGEGGEVQVYVVRGEVAYAAGEAGGGRGVVHAGEELTLAGGRATVEPAVLWQGLDGRARATRPEDATGPSGVGTLDARVPGEEGLSRWPLVVRRLDVRVQIEGQLAVTEVDQVFFNPASEAVEGLYRVRVPAGAVLQRFAVDRGERLVDGYVRERAQARASYEAQVYRGSTDDPALLEWDAPGAYRARIYPIEAGESRRIVVRYVEWLWRTGQGEPLLYRYPMGGGGRPPQVQEFSLSADLRGGGARRVRAGMGATVEDGAVLLRRSDFRPRADFWMELLPEETEGSDRQGAYRAGHEPPERAPGSRAVPSEADERDYYYLPLVLPEDLAGEQSRLGFDLVVVADVSAATDRSHLELGRSVVESLVSHLGEADRVAIVTSDLTIRSVGGEETPALGPADAARSAGFSTVWRGCLRAARRTSARPSPRRRSCSTRSGRGRWSTWATARPRWASWRAGGAARAAPAAAEAAAALLGGGGLAGKPGPAGSADPRGRPGPARGGASERGRGGARILAHRERPAGAAGDGGARARAIDNVYPRGPVDAVLGGVLPVVGRIRDDGADHGDGARDRGGRGVRATARGGDGAAPTRRRTFGCGGRRSGSGSSCSKGKAARPWPSSGPATG